jgi:FkbM family methyltransferase
MPDVQATESDVRAAYRLILGRDPDPVGLAHYSAMVAGEAVSTRQLCSMLMTSSEFIATRERLVDMGGVVVAVDESEPEFGAHIAIEATWEPHIVGAIRANLSAGQVFVDVGANVGVMAFNAAQIVGKAGKVIAFEPNDENVRLFLRGTIENGFESFVTVYRVALSDRNMVFALQGGSNASLSRPQIGSRLAQAVRGDDILAAAEAVHLIKLDIEGHEPFALKGLEETLRRHAPLVLCEYNPRCLRDNAGIVPEEFAKQIFGLTRTTEVIEHDGKRSTVTSAKELTEMWLSKNHEAVISGFLPHGMLHFDLLFRATGK